MCGKLVQIMPIKVIDGRYEPSRNELIVLKSLYQMGVIPEWFCDAVDDVGCGTNGVFLILSELDPGALNYCLANRG